MGTGDKLLDDRGQDPGRDGTRHNDSAAARRVGKSPTRRWSGLYSSGPPTETGVGARTARQIRRRRHRLIAGLVALLAVTGVVTWQVTPTWWWSTKAYVDHLGYGPYEGEMPSGLRGQLADAMPGLVSFVERHRGLRFAAAPSVVFLPDQLFENELRAHVAFQQRHYVAGPTYDALGWLHDGDTFDRLNLDLSGSDVVALYGDWDGTIYLRGDRLTEPAKAELTALLTQSLDDQTFNLGALYGTRAEHDERTAYDALVTGDALLVEQAYIASRPAAQRCRLQAAVRLPLDVGCPDATPAAETSAVRAQLRFPETYGPRFVRALRERGGTAAVDAAFEHPPRSTADILSIAHYRTDRAFQVVDPPRRGGELVDFGTLGAYTISLALAHGHPGRLAGEGFVQGWRGDSYSTYRHGDELCVRDTAVFDTPAQAARFRTAAVGAGFPTRQGPGSRGATFTVCHPATAAG